MNYRRFQVFEILFIKRHHHAYMLNLSSELYMCIPVHSFYASHNYRCLAACHGWPW